MDVFFVLSGYLMTGILLANSERKKVLAPFYAARIRRIVPALLAVIIATFAGAWFLTLPQDFNALASHSASSILFVSNLHYYFEASYFGAYFYENLLLHTWSLSVEWQFYLLYPFVILAWSRYAKHRVSLTAYLVALFALSFFYSSYLLGTGNTSGSFYLPFSRTWQMLAGGIVYGLASPANGNCGATQQRRQKVIYELAGFALIALSFFFAEGQLWAGPYALIPVIGAALILYANNQQSKLTGNLLAQALGKWSYSIYLWHWPIAAYLMQFDAMTPQSAFLGFTASIALGWLSYVLIEQPPRKWLQSQPFAYSFVFYGLAVVLVVFLAFKVTTNKGYPQRFSPDVLALAEVSNDRNPYMSECLGSGNTPVTGCVLGGGDKVGAIVIGDSQASSTATAVVEAGARHGLSTLVWTYNDCPTALTVRSTTSPNYHCASENRRGIELIKEQYKNVPVFVINRASEHIFGPTELPPTRQPAKYVRTPYATRNEAYQKEFANELKQTACLIAETNPVYMLRPTPEFTSSVPATMARAAMSGEQRRLALSKDTYHQRHAVIWSMQDSARAKCNIQTLSPLPYLCEGSTCYGDKNGLPIYYDADHLTENGNKLLVPLFDKALKNHF